VKPQQNQLYGHRYMSTFLIKASGLEMFWPASQPAAQ
jgi:hypothetical protein